MKRTLFLSTFIALSFATASAQQPQPSPAAVQAESGAWINAAPANAGFTVLMPGKPVEKSDAVEGHPGVENHLLTLDTGLGGYVVSYVQFPEEVTDPVAIKELLDRGRDGGVQSTNGELKSEKEIKLNGYFGREWLMNLPGNYVATARAYWVKRRLYQIVFVANPKATDTPAVTKLRQDMASKFFDSFALSEVK